MVVKIREIRQRQGLTVYELAKRSGLTHSFVWKLDHDMVKRPSINTLSKLAKALDCNVNDLYDDDEVKQT